jgi:hypothetical protein
MKVVSIMTGRIKKDPFDLIEKGYELENESPWSSAYHFLEASNILRSNANAYHDSISDLDYKQRKVAALYEDQANAYFQKARGVLLQAMHKEYQSDETSLEIIPSRVRVVNFLHGEIEGDDKEFNLNMDTHQVFEPTMTSLDEEEKQKRRELLELFTPKVIQPEKQVDKKSSLEERLAMLNSSITKQNPKPKSDEQRLREIHTSLSGLGISLPTTSREDARQIMHGDNDVSEKDQLEQIMNMAQDEVLLNDHSDGNGGNDTKDIMQILKDASIRIDLDPDNYNDDSSSASTQTSQQGKKNDTDAEISFWRNLQIDDNNDEENQPISKVEEIKQYLATAQSLLLQTAICLEEMEEQGISFDDDHNSGHNSVHNTGGSATKMEPEVTTKDGAQFDDTGTEDYSDEEKVPSYENGVIPGAVDEMNLEIDTEPLTEPLSTDDNDDNDDANAEEHDQHAKVDLDENVAVESSGGQATAPDDGSTSSMVNHTAEMGTGGLQEAQDLITRVMAMWPSQPFSISKFE